MNEIQVGRYSDILHKLLGITEGSPTPTLAPDLIATVALESDRPEWAYLGNERLCWGQVTPLPVAGERSQVSIHNVTANSIVVVERVWITTGANLTFFMGHLDTPPSGGGAALGNFGFRDSRWQRGNQVTAANVYSAVGAAITNDADFMLRRVPANQENYFELPIVLTNGFGLGIMTFTTATSFSAGFLWRERVLTRNESKVP